MIENVERIRQAISQNSKHDVILVAVTKKRSPELINQMLALGVQDIAENRAQELLTKLPEIASNRRIHFIGHLQRNKVKDIIGHVSLIQSVDSLRLAQEIDRQSEKANLVQDILIQVNIAREEAKYGFMEEEVDDVLKQVAQLEHVRIQGLMMMAPYSDNPESVRGYFRKMKELFDYYRNLNYNKVHMKYLSMGMTNDFEVALQEGSNMIRVGTGLFL